MRQYIFEFLNFSLVRKAHYLVDKVKGLLREYYVCYNETFVDVLLQKVDESAGVILDNNCREFNSVPMVTFSNCLFA